MDLIDPKIRRKFDDALGSGDMFALFERTREAIQRFPDDPDAVICRRWPWPVWATPMPPSNLYERNRVAEIGTEDAVALKGRLLKDLATRASGSKRGRTIPSIEQGLPARLRLSDGYFSGINAATTSLLAGDEVEAGALAEAIGRRPDITRPKDYYAAASAPKPRWSEVK